MNEYLNIFIDKDYPHFLDKYLNTKTMDRIKYVTQFCGCDYTKLYSTKFLYTRFNHSLVVAHMVGILLITKVKQLLHYYMMQELLALLIVLTMYLMII